MPSRNSTDRVYRGRFAPSPTGELHFGSLIAAVASFLEARLHGGQWLVRIEDIDPPREVRGSARSILNELQRMGMEPDDAVLYQSTRTGAYEEAIEQLIQSGDAYWCGCSRSDLPPSGTYPGTCREGIPAGRQPRSVRLRTDVEAVIFDDGIQGEINTCLQQAGGDFVIRRADGLTAYQLAVVVDDSYQQVSHIVRGADLIDSTPRQLLLQTRLGLEQPEYSHLPVATDASGKKLGKRLHSDPVSNQAPVAALRSALVFLGHQPPHSSDLEDLWSWALDEWDISKVPRTKAVAIDQP